MDRAVKLAPTGEKETIIQHIFRAALVAMIVADLVEVIASVIDGMITGRFLGASQMAAYGLVKPFFSITGMVSAVLSSGAMTVTSKYLGQGDARKTQQIFSLTCFLGITMSMVMAAAGILFANPFARLLGANDALLADVRSYLIGLLIGVPAIVMGNVLTVFLQLEGKYKNVTGSVIATVLVDLLGDLIAVTLFENGMLGVGLATSASYYASLLVLLISFKKSGGSLRFTFRNMDWGFAGELFTRGMPKAVRRFCNVIRPWLINRMILIVGGNLAMAAFSVQNSSAELFELLGTCCGDAVVMMCGIFFGEENEDDLNRTITIAFRYVLFGVIPIAALCFFGAGLVAAFYLGSQTDAVDIASDCMRLYALKLPLLAFNEIYLNYFQAIGDVKRSHILSVLHRLVYIVVSVFVLGGLFGITGIWAAFPVSELLLALTILAMAAKHQKRIPVGISDLLFLPADFGKNRMSQFYREVRTTEEAMEASRAAGVFCRENGIDARRSYYAALCIEELAINDVTHGFYKEGQSAAIYLSALNNGELTIRFRDNGRNFDLTKWCNLFKEEDKTARIGIRMVVALAKDITYTNSFNTNNLKIDL